MTRELDFAVAYLARRYPMTSRERFALQKASSEPVPLFVLVRTRLGCIWRFREDLLGATIRELAKLAGREAPLGWPLEAARPPEREEPMARVLRELGMGVEVSRDLLVHKARWTPTREAQTVLFRVGALDDGLEIAEAAERAHMGSCSWSQRGAFAQLEAREWIGFADLIRFSPSALETTNCRIKSSDQSSQGSGN